MPGLRAACDRHIGSGWWAVELDSQDAQAVLFTFPNPTAAYGSGEPKVKIEFGARGDPWPTSRKVVRPYVEEVHAGIAPSAVAEVTALNPERTFWEKVTMLHALHHATIAKPDKSVLRLSRHVYDVHRIWNTSTLRTSLLDRKLLPSPPAHRRTGRRPECSAGPRPRRAPARRRSRPPRESRTPPLLRRGGATARNSTLCALTNMRSSIYSRT